MSVQEAKPPPALCVADGHRTRWLGGGLDEPMDLPLAVWAFSGPEGEVRFGREKPEAGEAVHIEALGTQLAAWPDADLLAAVLGGFFAQVAEALPAGLSASLLYSAWMGPRERRRLCQAAGAAGLRLRDGIERGFAPVLARAARGGSPPETGGVLVADACGPDLDLYAIGDTAEGEQRTLRLLSYRRCREVFSPYYEQRGEQRRRIANKALSGMAEDAPVAGSGPRLATSERAAELLAQMPAGRGEPAAAPEVLSFSAYLTSLEAAEAADGLRILRRWRYWLDHGDERLAALTRGEESFPWRGERLFAIPAETPPQLTVALHAGFTPVRAEAHELCRLTLSKPDYYTAPGHLLVTTELTGTERGSLAVEVVQHGRPVVSSEVTFPGGTEEP